MTQRGIIPKRAVKVLPVENSLHQPLVHNRMVEAAGRYTTTIFNFRIHPTKAPLPDDEFDEQERLMAEEKRQAQAHPPSAPPAKKPRKAPEADPERKGSDTRSTVIREQLTPSAPAPYMNYVLYNIGALVTQEYRAFAAASAVLEVAAGLAPKKNRDRLKDALDLKHVPVSGCPKEFFRVALRPLLVQYFSEMPAHARSSGGTHNSAADYYAAERRVVEGLCAGEYSPLEQQEFDALKSLEVELCGIGRTTASFGRKDRAGTAKKDKAAKAAEAEQRASLMKLQERIMDGSHSREMLERSIPEKIREFVRDTYGDNIGLRNLAEFILGLDQEMVHNILATVAEEARDAVFRETNAKAKAAFRAKKGRPPKKEEAKHRRAVRPDAIYEAPQAE